MKYIAVDFTITCQPDQLQTARDILSQLAAECGFESFEDTPHGVTGYIQSSLYSTSALDDMLALFPLQDCSIAFHAESVPDLDWNATWEAQGFDPIEVADRLVVYDARRGMPQVENPDMIKIAIEPRLSFGSGTHATTQMMLRQLCQRPLQGQRVLDCGCGTGILSIAAAKLGATQVVGYDIDEWSVENAIHNAKLNHVVNSVSPNSQFPIFNFQFLHGDATVLSSLDTTFDVIVANIHLNILMADMPAYRAKMAPKGRLLLSGFYEADAPQLIERATKFGLHCTASDSIDGWNLLELGMDEG